MQRFDGLMLDLSPGGWWDETKAFIFHNFQWNVLDKIDVRGHHLAMDRVAHGTLEGPAPPLYRLVFGLMPMELYKSIAEKAAAVQAGVDQAIVACALERYALDRHAYPAALAELTPAYIDRVPPDVMDGAPMRYRRTPDGRYLLYSIGWNGQDDGGQVAWQKEIRRRDDLQGDWVWQYQELQPPPAIQRSR